MTNKGKNVTKLRSQYVQQYDAYMDRQLKKKKRVYRRLVLFAILVIISLGSLITYHLEQRALYAEKQQQYEQLNKEMASLEEQEDNLKQEVELLKDEEYVLQIAKTNYFFSEEGEIIFKIPEEDLSY